MISWLKRFFKKEEVKKTSYAPKSSMKEVLEELINSRKCFFIKIIRALSVKNFLNKHFAKRNG